MEPDEIPLDATVPNIVDDNKWKATLERAIPAIVAIRFMTVRHFDTYNAGSSSATGFVVDARRGIILTNRHVVRPGPVIAEVMFCNHEETPVYPMYIDPIHDFGFYRYDPAKLRFIEPAEIILRPDKARVGMAIRVIGNDAGEKLSILSGILARLDRKVPKYGANKYNDMDTFYYQAASMTSGGSSGSPVIDIDGDAIALNAGSKTKSAASFYLPLDRVVRALRLLQQGVGIPSGIPRGTLQVSFVHETYDEARRLGLRTETEALVRQARPTHNGILVVQKVLPKGPGEHLFEPGDVVIRVNGKLAQTFVEQESILDDSVGQPVTFELERGGKVVVVTVKVQDLHSIIPNEYFEFGGGVVHPLSYHQAINHMVPVGGVVVSSSGYSFRRAGLEAGSVILSIQNIKTPDLATFEQVITSFPHRKQVSLRYYWLENKHLERVTVLEIDRHWAECVRRVKDYSTGIWNAIRCAAPPAPTPPQPQTTTFNTRGGALAAALAPCFAMVSFDVPYLLDGLHNNKFKGLGLVVDAEKGLLVVDRNTVPCTLGDISITFAESVEITGSVLFIHSVHNFSIIKYDPSLLGTTPVQSISLSNEPIDLGSTVWFVGATASNSIVTRLSTVTKIEPLGISPSAVPRFRDMNIEVYHLDHSISTYGGVLATPEGHVQAFWCSFSKTKDGVPAQVSLGLPIELIAEVVNIFKNEQPMQLRSLEVELWKVAVATARHHGLTQEWVDRLQEHDCKHQALIVKRLVAGSPAASALVEGDLLLSANGQVVTRFRDLELATMHSPTADLVLFRNGEEKRAQVETLPIGTQETEAFLVWAGTFIQESYRDLKFQQRQVPEGVYCSRYFYGSPAEFYDLKAKVWILAVNDTPTPTLWTFLEAVRHLPNGEFVRMKTIDTKGKVRVLTLRTNDEYWPLVVFQYDEERGWRNTTAELAPLLAAPPPDQAL